MSRSPAGEVRTWAARSRPAGIESSSRERSSEKLLPSYRGSIENGVKAEAEKRALNSACALYLAIVAVHARRKYRPNGENGRSIACSMLKAAPLRGSVDGR